MSFLFLIIWMNFSASSLSQIFTCIWVWNLTSSFTSYFSMIFSFLTIYLKPSGKVSINRFFFFKRVIIILPNESRVESVHFLSLLIEDWFEHKNLYWESKFRKKSESVLGVQLKVKSFVQYDIPVRIQISRKKWKCYVTSFFMIMVLFKSPPQ